MLCVLDMFNYLICCQFYYWEPRMTSWILQGWIYKPNCEDTQIKCWDKMFNWEEEILSTLRLPGLRLGDWSNGGGRSPHVQVAYAYVNNPIHPYIDFSPVGILWTTQYTPIHPQPHVFSFSIGLVTMQLDLHMCWSCAKYSFYQCQNFYICLTASVLCLCEPYPI